MSTRCNIIVRDKYNAIQLYRHSDGYPDTEHGVVEDLKKALNYAWELPRMEADDMAAAIVASMKQPKGGNICIDGTAKLPQNLHGDIEYYYVIEPGDEKWRLEVLEVTFPEYPDNHKRSKTIWKGFVGDDY